MMRRSLAVLLILLCAAVAVGAVSSSRWERVPAKDHARANPLSEQPEAATALAAQ